MSSPPTTTWTPNRFLRAISAWADADRIRRYPPALFLLTLALFGLTLIRSHGPIEPDGKIIGRDYFAFYTGGSLVNAGRLDDLFDAADHTAFQQEFMADINPLWTGTYPYRNPPHYAWFMSWFASLSYGPSLLAWSCLSLICFGATARLWRGWLAPGQLGIAALLVICMPSWFQALAGGQNTFISLLILTSFCGLLLKGRDGWAGIVLSLLAYKFYLIALPAMVLGVKGRWRAIAGLAAGGALTLIFTAAVMGPGIIIDYITFAPSQAALMEEGGFDIHKQHCWYGLFRLLGSGWMPLVSVQILTLTATGVTLLLLAVAWRGTWDPRSPIFGLQLSALVIATLATSAHLLHYDVTLISLPALLWLQSRNKLKRPAFDSTMKSILVIGFCWLAVAEPIARLTHIQLTPMLLLVLLGVIAGQVGQEAIRSSSPKWSMPSWN